MPRINTASAQIAALSIARYVLARNAVNWPLWLALKMPGRPKRASAYCSAAIQSDTSHGVGEPNSSTARPAQSCGKIEVASADRDVGDSEHQISR